MTRIDDLLETYKELNRLVDKAMQTNTFHEDIYRAAQAELTSIRRELHNLGLPIKQIERLTW